VRRLGIGLVLGALGLLAPAAARAADTLEVLELNGPSDNRIDLVITGDGYTAAQAGDLRSDAAALVEGLFATVPWSGYRGAFNVYLVITESAQSGADHPFQGLYVDTYFDGQFDNYGIEQLTQADQIKVLTVVTGLLPEADQVILILNDPAYGGSGGTVAMVSTLRRLGGHGRHGEHGPRRHRDPHPRAGARLRRPRGRVQRPVLGVPAR
jgi:hypothetical protein